MRKTNWQKYYLLNLYTGFYDINQSIILAILVLSRHLKPDPNLTLNRFTSDPYRTTNQCPSAMCIGFCDSYFSFAVVKKPFYQWHGRFSARKLLTSIKCYWTRASTSAKILTSQNCGFSKSLIINNNYTVVNLAEKNNNLWRGTQTNSCKEYSLYLPI